MAKQTRNKIDFTTIRVEGAILPADLLVRIAKQEKDIKGLREEEDYHLSGEKFKDAITQSWNRLRGAWANFQSLKSKLTVDDTGTTITREKWLLPLFQQLGYGRLSLAKKSIDIEDKSYPISHTWEQFPIHLVGCGVDLDKRSVGALGVSRSSPHSMVQELLNRSKDYLWAFVSNGLKLRILRDNISLTRQAYVEFDLESMMQGEVYPDFSLLWLLCHQSRVEGEKPEDFWLEKWSKIAQEQGTRFLDKLRKGVEKAISLLGSGFLANPNNKVLRSKLQTGQLNGQDYYRQLLRLVYRLLFLFVAEDRELLLDPNSNQQIKDRYNKYYSTARLRKLAGKRKGTKHNDLWQGLRIVMQKLGNGGCTELGLPALGSFLFSNRALPDLDNSEIDNIALLETLRALAYTEDGNSRRSVDYKNLRSEELGSVYESLLELHPIINTGVDIATFELKSVAGNERKTTGSYYTPESLVQCLLDSALDPVVDDAIKGLDRVKAEEAILNLKVCDPACGSGHFLVAAAHRMAKRLASIRTGDTEPSPPEIQKALRNVIGRCIYGVDINEMAVELCKVALWMEAIEPGKPLSFLEHHIQCGNSLLGTTPALMADGIPDEAFSAIEGDDKKEVTALKKRNQKEKAGQESMFSIPGFLEVEFAYEKVSESITGLDLVSDDSIENIKQKQKLYENLLASKEYYHTKLLADAWCSAFVWKKTKDSAMAITEGVFRQLKNDPSSIFAETLLEIDRLSQQYKFFHWYIAFPTVFTLPKDGIGENKQAGWNGGFDVVLGNPPWERIKIQEKEWFATRRPEIANASNASERSKKINALIKEDPALHEAFLDAIRQSEGESYFVRSSNRFPLCGRGDVNTYSIFTETNRMILSSIGRVGCIVPSGIATDDTTKFFFQDLMQSKSLVSLYSFENEEFIFPNIHHATKFCLLTFSRNTYSTNTTDFAFFLRQVGNLKDENKHFSLTIQDLKILNPNTCTCPIFRSKKDANLTKYIYQRTPILIKEETREGNSWDIKFTTLFHMANDSHYFQTHHQLKTQNCNLVGNIFYNKEEKYLPLYEGKMFWHFDHRFGTYEGQTEAQANQGKLPELDEEQHKNPSLFSLPRYWIKESIITQEQIKHKQGKYYVVFRDITSSVVLRTAIFTIIPGVAVGHTSPVVVFNSLDAVSQVCFLACLNSYIVDYSARQSIGGSHLTYSYLKQLPVLPPSKFNEQCIWDKDYKILTWIFSRGFELTYTAWDLEAFAKDCGYEGPPFKWDEERRFLIRAELDAAYFHLYQIARDDVDYIMETFPIVKRKDEKAFGEYRTKRVILEVYDAMAEAIKTGIAYQTIVSPPPADPSVAHPPRETL